MCRELLAEQLIHARTWNTQKLSAKNWSIFRGPTGAVNGGLIDLGLLLPSQRVKVLEEKMFDTRLACSQVVNEIPSRRSKTRQWKAWAELIVLEELKRGHGWRQSSPLF